MRINQHRLGQVVRELVWQLIRYSIRYSISSGLHRSPHESQPAVPIQFRDDACRRSPGHGESESAVSRRILEPNRDLPLHRFSEHQSVMPTGEG
jgi:hypothetical protein